ncbi:hypothetical protein EJF44_16360 [Salmonella enterica]|nr:hypothetical protein [Salmonella enterica]
MAERNNKQHDKGGTVHIDAETMKKIEEYQAFIRKNHPETATLRAMPCVRVLMPVSAMRKRRRGTPTP